jgi:hypothetical protein
MTTSNVASEAKPFDRDSLSKSEKKLVDGVMAKLTEMAPSDPKGRSSSPELPWFRPDDNRESRMIVIDGERGTGKTTLLLTLLKELSDPSASGGPKPVALLDFDPIPPAIPLHAWIIQSFKPLVDFVEGSLGRGVSKVAAAPLSEQHANLLDAAVTAWSSLQDAGGQTDRHFQERDRLANQQSLGQAWWAFVDELWKRLQEVGKAKASLLVIAIDDVDLQVERVLELIHATRLLYHPRVAYVITADLNHMREAVLLDYQRRHCKLGGFTRGERELLGGESAEKLTIAAMDKAFPETHRFRTEWIQFSDIFARFSDVLDNADWGWVKTAFEAMDKLRDRGVSTGLGWRDLQRMDEAYQRDQTREISGLAAPTEAKRRALERAACAVSTIVEAFLKSGMGNGFRPSTRTFSRKPDRTGGETDQPTVAVIQVGVAAKVRIDQPQVKKIGFPRRYLGLGQIAEVNVLTMSEEPLEFPGAVLLHLLHHRSQNCQFFIVEAPNIEFEVGRAFIWSVWDMAPSRAIFNWPLIQHPKTVFDFIELEDSWNTWQESAGSKDIEAKLLLRWTCLQLIALAKAHPATQTLVENLSIDSDAQVVNSIILKLLAETHASPEKHREWGEDLNIWLTEQIPLLIAPEFNLPRAALQRFADTIGNIPAWTDKTRSALTSNRGLRHQAVMNALYESMYGPDPIKRAEPTDDDADALIAEADRRAVKDHEWESGVERLKPVPQSQNDGRSK